MSTTRYVLICCFVQLYATTVQSQKQANVWYFPDQSGLDFSTGEAVPLDDGILPWSEGCSSICDSSGQLLMYANPTTVWNRNHQIMPYGDGLLGGNSSTQGCLIVPKPSSDHIFYVFTLDEFQHDLENGLRYSVVDMCCDNGLGCVMFEHKNILILEDAGEKLAATYHSNGVDIWILSREHHSNEFHAFLITESGIQNSVVSAIGWDNDQNLVANAIGQMKISPDGSKVAMAVSNQMPNVIQLFDFDNTTGIVSNMVDLPTPTNTGSAYGVAFSPDNSKLYIQGMPPTGLDQYDISSGVASEIIDSQHHVTWNGPYGGTGLQLANNGKIYVCQPINIGVIHSPNLPGDACDFEGIAISSYSFYSLPSFIDSFQYTNTVTNCGVGISSNNNADFVLYPNPASDQFTINIPKGFLDGEIQICNSVGATIEHVMVNGRKQIQYNLTKYPSGVYYIQVRNSSHQLSQKIIVE